MATSDKLEHESKLSGFLERIKAVKDHVAKEEQRTESIQKCVQTAHSKYMESLKMKETLTEQIEELRRKIVEVSKEDLEKRIEVQKEIYSQTQQMLKTAEEKRDKLEERLDDAENLTRDHAYKMELLNMELEYKNIDSERRTKDYNVASEAATSKEKGCEELDGPLQSYESRVKTAQDRIEDLELKIQNTEEAIESTIQEKKDMESNFRELILAANQEAFFM